MVVESAEGSEILGLAEKAADFGGRRCVDEERLRGVVVTVGKDGEETALEEGVKRDVLGGGETGEGERIHHIRPIGRGRWDEQMPRREHYSARL